MIWKAVNDKILFKVEEIKKQNIFSSDDLGNLRKGVVLSIGENVKEVLILSEIILPFQDITYLEDSTGICSERNVISVNNKPIHNKLEVKLLPKENEFGKMLEGEIIKTPLNTEKDFKIGDIIKFKMNTYFVLPNNNVLLSEDKVFMKKD